MEIVDVVVTGVTKYSFEDNSTGKLIEGCNVHFLNLETEDNGNLVGYVPMKSSIPYDQFKKFTSLEYPQHCRATVKLFLASKRPSVKFTDFDPVGAIDLMEAVALTN